MEDSSKHFLLTHNQYELLGEGAYGKVYLAVKKSVDKQQADAGKNADSHAPRCTISHDVRVVKHCKLDTVQDGETVDLQKEIATLRTLCAWNIHPGILPLLDYHIDGPVQWLTTPFVTGGTLFQLGETYPEAITTAFVAHVAENVASALIPP